MIIEQQPLYNTMPVGQDIIFAVSDNTILANNFKVKFTAQVFISDDVSNVYQTTSLAATLKVTPNNKGVGIFSLTLTMLYLARLKEHHLLKTHHTQFI